MPKQFVANLKSCRRVRFKPQRLFQHFAGEGSKAGGFLFRVELAKDGS